MATQEKVDVVIVGAGPSGAVFADVLARAGKKVVVLEFGPDWDMKEFVSSEIWAQAPQACAALRARRPHNPGHGANAGWGTGGAMLHFYANWPRLHPSDFRVKSEHGRGLDWPISYDDLAPYYDRIAEDVGIAGDAAAERRWFPIAKDYPMPPLKAFRNGTIFNDAFKAHGIPLAPMPTSINSTDYKGRPACTNCGWCHAGCAIGARRYAAGRPSARRAQARRRAAAVQLRHARAHQPGRRPRHRRRILRRQEASSTCSRPASVVLAAYSAENPRIMLNSATDKHPKGLANKNELVGKYLMCHALSTVWAMFDEDVENHMGTAAYQFMSYEHYGKTHAKKGFGSTFIRSGSAMKPNAGLAGCAARSVRAAARRLHEARGARAHPHRQLRRGTAARGEPRRAVERQGRVRAADRAHHPRIRPGDGRLLGLSDATRRSRSSRPPSRRKPGRAAARRRDRRICSAAPSWAPTRRTR